MKGLRDLRPLATAPALEAIELIDDAPSPAAIDLAALAGLPNLKAVTPGLGSRRRNEAATAMLGLPLVREPFDWAADPALPDPAGD